MKPESTKPQFLIPLEEDQGEELTPPEKRQVGAIMFALCVLGAVVVLLLRGCT